MIAFLFLYFYLIYMHNKVSFLKVRNKSKTRYIVGDSPPAQNRFVRSQLNNKYQSQDITKKIDENSKQIKQKQSLDHKRTKSFLFPTKSQFYIGKKNITVNKKQNLKRRSISSFYSKQKNRSYSIDQSFIIQRKQKIQLVHTSTNLKGGTSEQQMIVTFASSCFGLQDEYKMHCQKGEYNQAYEKLVILLNYTVDLSNSSYFFKVIFTICQFYQILQQYQITLKWYNQLKEASLLMKNYQYLVISLIGISKCADKGNLFPESIKILKKALEFAWFVKSAQLQMNIYDEIGQKYDKLGDLQKANVYHKKYSNAIIQEDDSPLSKLSKQQIEMQQSIHFVKSYQNISQSYLYHLNLPIRDIKKLPKLLPNAFTSRQNLPQPTVKPINQLGYFDQICYQIKRIFKHWIFELEGQDPSLQNVKQIQLKKENIYNHRKFAFIDFKLNQHLKSKGIKILPKSQTFIIENMEKKQQTKRKQSLDKKIQKMLDEPGLEKQWYENIVKRVKYDQKRKLIHISDPVRLHKNNSKAKQKQQMLKHLFKQIIQFMNKRTGSN